MDSSGPPHDQKPGEPGRQAWQQAAASTRGAARSTARATRRAGLATKRASAATRRTVRRATNAQGAGETGMAKLTELSGVNAAGDALIAVSLAGTLFFSVPIGEARSRVLLYLLITMVPFALLAPLIGPVLDRFRSGRRYALAATFAVRALLAWSMVGSVASADLWLYPAVFGVLIGSRAYLVTRAAGVPRLLPPNVPLVRANSWMSMAGLLASAVAAAAGIVVTKVMGPEWTLRGAAVVFIVGAVLAVKLPKRVDSAADERRATLTGESVGASAVAAAAGVLAAAKAGAKARAYVGPAVELGLRANMAFRGVSGFLTLFLAFYLRQEPIGSLSDTTAIGLVIGAAGVGSVIGTSTGALIRDRAPEFMLALLLLAETLVVVLAAVWWGLVAVLAAGFVVGFAQTLGKLALDALIQRDVEEDVRTSAFARSETWLQMAWVSGGTVGVMLPLRGDVGFGIAGGGMIVLTMLVFQGIVAARRSRKLGTAGAPDPDSPPARPDAGRADAKKADLRKADLGKADVRTADARTAEQPHRPPAPPAPRPAPEESPGHADAPAPAPYAGPLHPGYQGGGPPPDAYADGQSAPRKNLPPGHPFAERQDGPRQ